MKQSLTIVQEKDILLIKGEFSKEYYCAKELWLHSRENEVKTIKIAETSSNFDFKINLKDLNQNLQESEPMIYDCYIKVSVPVEKLSEKTILKIEDKAEYVEVGDELYIEYLLRLGRFQETYIDQLSFFTYEDKQSIFSITKKVIYLFTSIRYLALQ